MGVRWGTEKPAVDAVITGTGRCGTGYMAALLNEMGVPAGHEKVFTPYGISPDDRWRVDVSWLAGPVFAEHKLPAVNLVRHPEDVISSLIGIRFFSDPVHLPYRMWVERFMDITGDDLVDAPHFYWQWNSIIERNSLGFFRIEDMDKPDEVERLLGTLNLEHRSVALPKIDKTLNSRERVSFSVEDIRDSRDHDYVLSLMDLYGY